MEMVGLWRGALLPGRRTNAATRFVTFMFREHLNKGIEQVCNRVGMVPKTAPAADLAVPMVRPIVTIL
jgi:hypothetical protein